MNSSFYADSTIILTTKHAKAKAIAPIFWNMLNAHVVEYQLDTDLLGTFSGEIKRELSPLECARKKCEMPFDTLLPTPLVTIASEGTFSPHPFMPLIHIDYEILYLIDKKHDFHLHVSLISEKTNFQAKMVDSWEELLEFASRAEFPSHALILKPYKSLNKELIFKGITNKAALEDAFREVQKQSQSKEVWVETDMRAHLNPTRMKVIGELAKTLANRLRALCPECKMPGWGLVQIEKGLPCSLCKSSTELTKGEIFGCVKCSYKEKRPRNDGLEYANPQYCPECNP